MAGGLDSFYSAPVPADQQPTAAKAAAAASQKTSDTFVVEKSGLNVIANGVYSFSFQYGYADTDNPSDIILGPRSANFRFTLEAPDYTVAAQNVVVTPGTLSYVVKWDPIDKSLAANKWFIDAQIYESKTGSFTGEEYLVWNGTGNTATILVDDLNDRWIRVDTRDQDYHKKSVKKGPFKATDPIVVDTTGPANVNSVSVTSSGIDTSGYLGFNAYANISWPAVTGGGIRGYRIRFSNDNNATYSYVDSPGTGTAYKLAGLAIGSTYKIAVATYDEYNNTSSSYISGPDVTVTGTPSVANYITGGPFQFGVGVGGVSTNKGLYFDASNYWYINSLNSARLKVGGSTSNYLLWDGSTFAVDGNITARGGTFSGNILMSTANASIYSGTVNAAGNLTGDGFALNSSGLKVAKGTSSVTLDAATGTITANAGTIAGWTLGTSTLSKNNVIIDSAGKIQIGAAAATSVYLQKAAGTSPTKDYVMWAGNNTPDANAKFRVAADGTLYATGAIFGTGTTVSGYATSGDLGTTNTNVTNLNTTVTGLSTTVTNQGTSLSNKLTKSASVITSASNEIQGLNAMGITMFANNNSSATAIPTSGARVVMNSLGIVGYDSTSTNNTSGITFSLSGSTGSAYFKGEVQATSGKFTGEVQASSGTFTGTVNASSGYIGSSTNGWTFDSSGTLSNGTAGTLSATTIFPKANNTAIGVVGNSNNISYYSNRGIIVNPGTGSVFGYSVFGTGLITLSGTNPQLSSSIPVRINDSFAPNSDNAYSLGFTDARWQIVRSFNGVSTTSDQRLKTDINDSTLGLNFIKSLRPVSYKFISGGKIYKDGQEKQIVDGVVVEPEMVDRPGQRTHWGFIAQEVKEAIDNAGVEDFGGWQLDDVSDPESSQSLVHHQFIGPMTKAIQELSDMVESLQEEINTLKGI